MLDRNTVARIPHADDDKRASVEMQADGATLTLFFAPEGAWTGEAELLEIRFTQPASGKFEPWRLMPRAPLHVQYARATLAWKKENVVAALDALRENNSPRRGLSEDFLKLVADQYRVLVNEGEPYPIKALAEMQPVDKSTASRWVSAARARGYLPASGSDREEQS